MIKKIRPVETIVIKKISIFLLFSLFLGSLIFSNTNDLTDNKNFNRTKEYEKFFYWGEQYSKSGDYEKAISSFERSLFLAQKEKDNKRKLDSLIVLGIQYWNIGKIKESSDKFTAALSIANDLKEEEKMSFCAIANSIYTNYMQAKDYRSSGKFQESIDTFNTAIDLSRKISSKEHELKCLRQLSLSYWELGNYQEFFLLNRKAYVIAKQINHKQEEGRCLNNIGLYYWKLDNYTEALKYYEKSLEIARKTKNIEEEGNCLINISAIYLDIGNYDRALEYLIETLSIDRKAGNHTNISEDLNNIGSVFRRKGIISENIEDFNASIKYYGNSLEMARKISDINTEIKVLNNLGTVYSYLRNNYKSLDYFRLALRKAEGIQNSEEISNILNNIGIVYSQLGNYEESTKYYQRAIDLALKIQGGKILWEAYLELANSYKSQNDFTAALDNYKKSISVIENIRSGINVEELKATYFGTDRRIEAYFNVIDLLIKHYQKYPEPRFQALAFNFLEKAKARSLLDSIEVSRINLGEGISQKLLNQETELMNEISKLHTKLLTPQLSEEQRTAASKELESYEEQLESLKREIRSTSPAYANLRYPKTITLEEAQHDLLDKETAFFAYILGTDSSYAFVITQKDLKIFSLPGRKEIQRLVREYLSAITDVENQDFHLGNELFTKLVLPGLADVKAKKIVFVPDDVLYFLPFETLLTKADSREWLIKSYDIAYVPSLSSLRELVERKKSRELKPTKDILALGDPSFGENEVETEDRIGNNTKQGDISDSNLKFYRLKFSGLEIEKIASLFKPDKRDILLRAQASEENLKKENLLDYRIIHLATHALIDDKKPARSAIVLNIDQDPNEDGLLQMREIFNLKLNADLVTLSACQTGLGQLIKGEGIEGLRRAFFYAGASSVMLSLWAINDQASYQLLERFYIYLRASSPIMGALRKAKLEMINSQVLSHPYYWGGFISTGETDIVVFPRRMNRWIVATLSLCAGLAILILIMNREKNHISIARN